MLYALWLSLFRRHSMHTRLFFMHITEKKNTSIFRLNLAQVCSQSRGWDRMCEVFHIGFAGLTVSKNCMIAYTLLNYCLS